MKLALCIPTFKRAYLLRLLLDDVAAQTVRPDKLVVVDGDPASGEVRDVLAQHLPHAPWSVVYLPSNHANLAYQRYLGFLATGDHELLLYLDDDLRISDAAALEQLVVPLLQPNSTYVAGTARIRYPAELGQAEGAVRDRIEDSRRGPGLLTRWLGASHSTHPGGLTAVGNRIAPNASSRYADVEWLRGGVMVFRTEILSDEFFSDDLFALTHAGCGLGEDTFLGRRALSRGKVFMANEVVVDHPNADAPKAYPIDACRMGYATAYSRRFINDTYRGFGAPSIQDRWSLVRGLAGGSLLSIMRAVRSANRRRAAYAAGYLFGAVNAFARPPRAARLTPHIRWRSDALSALKEMERL
jgi:glycosyltransferase involved in cell wall biosynthesis